MYVCVRTYCTYVHVCVGMYNMYVCVCMGSMYVCVCMAMCEYVLGGYSFHSVLVSCVVYWFTDLGCDLAKLNLLSCTVDTSLFEMCCQFLCDISFLVHHMTVYTCECTVRPHLSACEKSSSLTFRSSFHWSKSAVILLYTILLLPHLSSSLPLSTISFRTVVY